MLIPFESLKPYLNPDNLYMLSFATDPHSLIYLRSSRQMKQNERMAESRSSQAATD